MADLQHHIAGRKIRRKKLHAIALLERVLSQFFKHILALELRNTICTTDKEDWAKNVGILVYIEAINLQYLFVGRFVLFLQTIQYCPCSFLFFSAVSSFSWHSDSDDLKNVIPRSIYSNGNWVNIALMKLKIAKSVYSENIDGIAFFFNLIRFAVLSPKLL